MMMEKCVSSMVNSMTYHIDEALRIVLPHQTIQSGSSHGFPGESEGVWWILRCSLEIMWIGI